VGEICCDGRKRKVGWKGDGEKKKRGRREEKYKYEVFGC
jgi:hypothetical protein